MSDHELLDRLRAGDDDAFDAIFHEHYSRLVGLAESMLRDRAPAEEIAQDVMLELWRRRDSLRLEAPLRAYLLRATRNRTLNQIRHQRIAHRAEPYAAAAITPVAPADHDAVQSEIDAALRDAVDGLPPRCREIFELSRVHGLSYAEIAHTMEISVKTVEAQMGKALRYLRDQLSAWLPSSRGI